MQTFGFGALVDAAAPIWYCAMLVVSYDADGNPIGRNVATGVVADGAAACPAEYEGPFYGITELDAADQLGGQDFDFWVRLEVTDGTILAAFARGQSRMTPAAGYAAHVGGQTAGLSRLTLFGSESPSIGPAVSPGEHTVQLSRQRGIVWILIDGRAIGWAAGPA